MGNSQRDGDVIGSEVMRSADEASITPGRSMGPAFSDEMGEINTARHKRFVIALIGRLPGRDERKAGEKKEKPQMPPCHILASF